LIADARPPAIVKCLDGTNTYEKSSYHTRAAAHRHRKPGQKSYRCPFGDHYHLTGRKP